MKISNRLIAFGLICGLAYRITGEGAAGIIHFLVNVSIPVIFLFLLYRLHVVGAGDIKLFSVISGFLSLRQMEYIVAISFLTAAAAGIIKLFYLSCTVGYQWTKRTLIHFSAFIFLGYIIVVWGCAIE